MRLALQHQVDAAQAHRHTARRIQGQVARLERARTAREIQRVVHPYGPDARRVRPTVGPHGRHEERHVGLGRVAGKNVARAAYGSSADAYRSRLRVEIGSVMVSVIPMRRTGPQIDTEPTKIVRLGQRGAVSLAAALAVPQVSDQASPSPAAT
jgi:hypothetical protein